MPGMSKEAAYSWDLDDTLIRRGSVTRIADTVNTNFFGTHTRTKDIATVSRNVDNSDIESALEKLRFTVHARRKAVPEALSVLQATWQGGADNYGNTARLNRKAWVEMTYVTLRKAGLDELLEDVFFTPVGIEPEQSKGAAIDDLLGRYNHVTHIDDDPHIIVYLAELFPMVQLFLIQYGMTKNIFKQEKIARLPNVKKIRRLPEVLGRGIEE